MPQPYPIEPADNNDLLLHPRLVATIRQTLPLLTAHEIRAVVGIVLGTCGRCKDNIVGAGCECNDPAWSSTQ